MATNMDTDMDTDMDMDMVVAAMDTVVVDRDPSAGAGTGVATSMASVTRRGRTVMG